MIAIASIFKVVPSWCYWLVVLITLCLGGELHGRHEVQTKWDAYVIAQKIAAKEEIDKRTEENNQLANIQTATSTNIQKAHDNEIAILRTTIAQSQRLRIGTKFCSSITGQAISQSTTSSDGADPTRRILSPSMDEAVKRLIMESEEAAATGRTAQDFIKQNGMEP